ncbi:unnamed protein product [Rotaria sp. Silwood2]|nr:unnamed protein product [Rotaria sp. Silwood2]CAF4021335.1 unnamed protein product [Rotaria sp. Silwood2]
MFIVEIYFLFFLPLSVDSQRYYAFVETLFVIDRNYFPALSEISYDDYIRTIVDTTNIVFQSQNDIDIKIEIIISNIVYLNIVQPKSLEPYAYESILRQSVSDYDRYDSIVLLWYQPWEGPQGAQGYAILKGACHPSYKIMYVLPYQNAAFYLAHEFGHQLGLNHQVDTACFTTSYMSVMTKSHTASYEQARWTKCENNWINENICLFECLFNKPDNYQPIKNKYSTLPGKRMNNNQQAKMIEPNLQSLGEVSSFTFMPSDVASRCLYLRYYIGGSNGEYKYAYSPMLPGSECGENLICYLDKCVSKNDIDPSLFNSDFDTEILYLNTHCSSGNNPKELAAHNHDLHHGIECIDWENDFLCEPSQRCPKVDDSSTLDLYIKHVCCAKCSPKVDGYDLAYSGDIQGGALGGFSSYESTSTAGLGAGAGEVVLGNSGGYYSSSSSLGGLGLQGASGALLTSGDASGGYYSSSASSIGGGAYDFGGFEQQAASGATHYAADAQGLYQDPNPQIIRRPAPGGAQTYTQRVLVRFLQPPQVPPPGPLIIKEVRPPQPPPPPPLYIRQRPPPAPILPPIVIREAPPKMPPPVATQVITKLLPAMPVPPRSVIIERLPPLPPKPRDIIVERWLPYRVQQKRRVIIQRAPPPVIPKPRNIIIYYEPPKAQVVRRFINMGVERANPAEYVARYGTQLEDAHSLITHARQAGVVEDITPPGGALSSFQSAGYGSYQSSGLGAGAGAGAAAYNVSGGLSAVGGAGYEIAGGLSTLGGAGYSLGGSAGYGVLGSTGGYSSSFESSTGDLGLSGYGTGLGGGSSSYETYSSEQIYG